MNAIDNLRDSFIKSKFGLGKLNVCVDWAVERLVKNEENQDTEIVLLAGTSEESEIRELTEKILSRYLDQQFICEEYWIGKYIVLLYDQYLKNEISIVELDPILWSLYYKLDNPNWLIMLCRNCEYATDIDSFLKPFEDEFRYISNLWQQTTSVEAFKQNYDPKISKTHDCK